MEASASEDELLLEAERDSLAELLTLLLEEFRCEWGDMPPR
jgi:hypothetical protein